MQIGFVQNKFDWQKSLDANYEKMEFFEKKKKKKKIIQRKMMKMCGLGRRN